MSGLATYFELKCEWCDKVLGFIKAVEYTKNKPDTIQLCLDCGNSHLGLPLQNMNSESGN